ncbi:MAG: hypothetical protein Q4F81_11650 [Eubacteriales bacterium]|nr:hypothetical protein [Eubacteriales bacterium]
MNIVSIILCGLALLTAVVNTTLFFREKKRTNTRFSALNNLLESAEHETNGYILECIDELDKIQSRVGNIEAWKSRADETMSGHGRSLREALRKIEGLRDDVDDFRNNINDLRTETDNCRDDIVKLKSENDETKYLFSADKARHEQISSQVDALRQAISDLELDYKEAQEAANSVNDYASSLMNIFNFDPMEAEKKARSGGKAE